MPTCLLCDAALLPAEIFSPDRLHGTPGSFAVARCSRCGAGVTLPVASAEQLAGFYPEDYGPYSRPDNRVVATISSVIRSIQGFVARRSGPLAALRGQHPGVGLDIGSGRGDLSAQMQIQGWRMTAIDPSAEAVRAARARGIDARAGVLSTVQLEPGHYDFAVFQHSLEHTLDPVGDLRRTYKAVRPGGLVLISVPNFGSWQRRRFGGSWYHLDVPRHRVHLTAEALHRALREVGFADVMDRRSSSAVGLAASVQYRLFGRCLFPAGLGLRIAAGLCLMTVPLTALLDRVLGEGDLLHVVARRPAAGS